MKRRQLIVLVAAVAVATLLPAAVARAGDVIAPGPDANEDIQEALILAEAGAVVELGEGTFELALPLSLARDGVTVRGQGIGKTVLSFAKQETGSEGFLVTGSGCTLEAFTVADTKGDGIKVKGANGITLRQVRAEWTAGPKTENGGYGLYPVECKNVLVDGCSARGASDAGIYVGQSENVIIRGCRVEENVAGIEVENSNHVDVHGNTATKNTGGILVFDLPDLPRQGGGHVRVFDNDVKDNDTPNFAAKGNIVALVPRGTGLLIMANRNVEVFENRIGGHPTTNVLISSYLTTGREIKDPKYYPFPEGIHIHDNEYGACGSEPDGELGKIVAGIAGLPLPSIVWDGVVNPEVAVEGALPHDRRLVITEKVEDPGKFFINLDLLTAMRDPKAAKPSRDLAPHEGEREPLTPAKVPGAE